MEEKISANKKVEMENNVVNENEQHRDLNETKIAEINRDLNETVRNGEEKNVELNESRAESINLINLEESILEAINKSENKLIENLVQAIASDQNQIFNEIGNKNHRLYYHQSRIILITLSYISESSFVP